MRLPSFTEFFFSFCFFRLSSFAVRILLLLLFRLPEECLFFWEFFVMFLKNLVVVVVAFFFLVLRGRGGAPAGATQHDIDA